jgi:[acyl-carrier-protein] S-malonyltransferase
LASSSGQPDSGERAAGAAWIFPGQGSQQVGMGQDVLQASPAARRLFQDADSILGRPLSQICFQGPDDLLRQTENAQPAIMVVSLACLAAAEERGLLSSLTPLYVAGHSLGEYTAAVAANALSFEDGLRLVQERGRLMKLAGEQNPGTMAAILGLDEEKAAALCGETGAEVCNLNAPGQIVIGGSIEAVETAMERARSYGARRAVRLNVSGAFHTSLMGPAVEGMSKALGQVEIRAPSVPVIGNGSAEPLATAGALREELLYQLTHPVQWQRSVERMVGGGVSTFVELGPGEVLCGLIRRIAPEARTLSINGVDSLAQ